VILIVDDEERVLFVLRHALSKLENGFEVLTASTTKDALTKASDHAPDLLITDVIMPGMSGIELTRRITSRGGSPTVIWMTAYGCHSFRAQAEKLGVYRCVNKPLEIAQIRAVAREALAARVGSDEVDSL
jgi:CheY-like chemotaxis protein